MSENKKNTNPQPSTIRKGFSSDPQIGKRNASTSDGGTGSTGARSPKPKSS